MHSVSTVQCERVCYSGGHFVDPVMSRFKRMAPIEGTNWAGHDLELFPSLARRKSVKARVHNSTLGKRDVT